MDKSHYIYDNLVEMYGDIWFEKFPYIIRHISKYIDSHSVVLQTKYMNQRLVYGTNDEKEFYSCTGTDKEDVLKVLKTCKNIDQKNFPYAINPWFNITLILSCFYEQRKDELLKKYKIKDLDAAALVRLYLGMKIYSLWQMKIFKYPYKNELMDYVLEHMNKKSDITNVSNLYVWIKNRVDTNTFIRGHDVDLVYMPDVDIKEYCVNLENRIKSSLKNVFVLLRDAHAAGKQLVTEDIQATNSEDGNSFYTLTTSISNSIENLTKKVMQSFIQDQNIRMNLLIVACKKSNSSTDKVERMLRQMRESNDEKLMRRIISDILSYWIVSKKRTIESIHSTTFLKSCASAYSISNTYDPFIKDLKIALAELLEKISSDFMKGSQSSKNGYKRSVFMYILFYISTVS